MMHRSRRIAPLLTLVIVVVCASADTIHVYPGGSIQTAINLAGPGDEIVVHPGTYAERINFNGQAVTLRSSDGPAATVIDGQQGGTVITCHSAETADTVLEGFRITGGRGGYGGGMHISGASPTVRNCEFQGNEAQYGGGIFCQGGHPTLIRCTFSQNGTTYSAGALYSYADYPGQPAAWVQDCVFADNHAESRAGAVRIWDTDPVFERCTFAENWARVDGGAVSIGGASDPTLTDCTFSFNFVDTLFGNWDSLGGAVYVSETSNPILTNCVLYWNHVTALYPHLSYGGGLATVGSAQPRLQNCTLASNYANLGAGLHDRDTAHLTIRSSILWDGGDEIHNQGSATVSITYSDVQGGWAGAGNINSNPSFDGQRLTAASPCINTGEPTYHPPGGRDLDGHARVLCGRVDMGAYEFGIGDHDCDRDVDAQDFIGGVACLTGPDNGPYAAGCEALDFEYDLDVDLFDVSAFQCLFAN